MSSQVPDTPLSPGPTWGHCRFPGHEDKRDEDCDAGDVTRGNADLTGDRYAPLVRRTSQRIEGASAMTQYLIAAILFVAMITTLVYLWKREHS